MNLSKNACNLFLKEPKPTKTWFFITRGTSNYTLGQNWQNWCFLSKKYLKGDSRGSKMTYFGVKRRKKMDCCTKEGVFYDFLLENSTKCQLYDQNSLENCWKITIS